MLEKVDDSTEARPWRNGKAVGNFGNDSLVEMASYTILGQAGWDLWSHFHSLGSLQSRLPSSTSKLTLPWSWQNAWLIRKMYLPLEETLTTLPEVDLRRQRSKNQRGRGGGMYWLGGPCPPNHPPSPWRPPPKLLKLFYTIIWRVRLMCALKTHIKLSIFRTIFSEIEKVVITF